MGAGVSRPYLLNLCNAGIVQERRAGMEDMSVDVGLVDRILAYDVVGHYPDADKCERRLEQHDREYVERMLVEVPEDTELAAGPVGRHAVALDLIARAVRGDCIVRRVGV